MAGRFRDCTETLVRLMDKILHYLKDPKLWELWYIPYYGSCRILSINRSTHVVEASRSPEPRAGRSYHHYHKTVNCYIVMMFFIVFCLLLLRLLLLVHTFLIPSHTTPHDYSEPCCESHREPHPHGVSGDLLGRT